MIKTTRYFELMRQRSDRADIRLEWIDYVVKYPLKEHI